MGTEELPKATLRGTQQICKRTYRNTFMTSPCFSTFPLLNYRTSPPTLTKLGMNIIREFYSQLLVYCTPIMPMCQDTQNGLQGKCSGYVRGCMSRPSRQHTPVWYVRSPGFKSRRPKKKRLSWQVCCGLLYSFQANVWWAPQMTCRHLSGALPAAREASCWVWVACSAKRAEEDSSEGSWGLGWSLVKGPAEILYPVGEWDQWDIPLPGSREKTALYQCAARIRTDLWLLAIRG
jgi:hypothetical protein